MKLSTRQWGMFWVLLTLSVASIPQLRAMPLHLVLIASLPILWRAAAEIRGWRPPGTALRVGITLACVALLIATYGGLLGRRAAVSLLTLMLALKLMETFSTRDARVVASLSLFLAGTQFLFTQGVTMIVYTVGTMLAALIALAMLHRREAFRPVGDAPPTGNSVFTELGFTLRLLALALPGALVVFLLFPRWSTPLWGVPEEALDARSGLSDSMTPGSIQSLFMDDSPAFRAEFETRLPPPSALYWRGPVLWDFDGRTWEGIYYTRSLRAETQPDADTAPWRYRVQLEPHEQRWLFALDYPAITPRGARLSMDYQLTARRPVTSLVNYDMASDPRFVDSPVLRPSFRRAALKVPDEFNPRTQEMMRQWREETPDNEALIDRALAWFNQEEFRYTLNPELLSRHSVDEFLFRTRSGFCEHYASAFTIMMRMAGIPARVVTGYQGGWYNEAGGYVLVRQSDAHAWSEVWLAGSGWVRIDPTAAVSPERIEGGALDAMAGRRHLFDFDWVRGMRNGFDLLQRHWNNWVITFNADRQSRLLNPFGIDSITSTQLALLLLAATGVLSLMLLPLILRMRVSRKPDPVVRAWQRIRKRLSRAGVVIEPGLAPMELARRAGSQMQHVAGELDRIAALYTRVRYAEESQLAGEFVAAVRDFRPPAKKTR